MVSKARDDLPEPDGPVMTVNARRGISRSIPFRLFCLAPRTTMWDFIPGNLAAGGPKKNRTGAGIGRRDAHRRRHRLTDILAHRLTWRRGRCQPLRSSPPRHHSPDHEQHDGAEGGDGDRSGVETGRGDVSPAEQRADPTAE